MSELIPIEENINIRFNTLVLAINSLSEKDKENVGSYRQIIDRAKYFENYVLEAKKDKE